MRACVRFDWGEGAGEKRKKSIVSSSASISRKSSGNEAFQINRGWMNRHGRSYVRPASGASFAIDDISAPPWTEMGGDESAHDFWLMKLYRAEKI